MEQAPAHRSFKAQLSQVRVMAGGRSVMVLSQAPRTCEWHVAVMEMLVSCPPLLIFPGAGLTSLVSLGLGPEQDVTKLCSEHREKVRAGHPA